MPKPIGNLVSNLKPKDKVSHKTLARFGLQNPLQTPPPAKGSTAAPKPKYKKRKK